jgi:hypothetical protein
MNNNLNFIDIYSSKHHYNHFNVILKENKRNKIDNFINKFHTFIFLIFGIAMCVSIKYPIEISFGIFAINWIIILILTFSKKFY